MWKCLSSLPKSNLQRTSAAFCWDCSLLDGGLVAGGIAAKRRCRVAYASLCGNIISKPYSAYIRASFSSHSKSCSLRSQKRNSRYLSSVNTEAVNIIVGREIARHVSTIKVTIAILTKLSLNRARNNHRRASFQSMLTSKYRRLYQLHQLVYLREKLHRDLDILTDASC